MGARYPGAVTSDATPPSATTAPPSSGELSGGPATRYRCAGCGNLTRFDVVTTRRTRAFHHYSVGGELTVEETEVLDEVVEEVTCRWCGHGRNIKRVTAAEAEAGA